MRNLKRALSLTLASVMLLGMMVVGTSAVGYPDVADEDNVEAIEVLQSVGVMAGDNNGNFNPDDYVTREQMAVIMAQLLNLDYAYYQGTNPFSDVPAWAAPYVAACAANGITSGIGGGMYGAGQNVSAVQAALMMLKALGYFQYQQDFGDDYVLATVKQGTEIGLFSQIDSNANAALTRNEVAQMALNALRSNLVRFTGDVGSTIPTANGDVVVGYRAEYTPRNSPEAKYNAIAGLTTTILADNGQYLIQLGEELYNGDLRLNDNARDPFGRPSRRWEYKGEEIGTYAKKELIREEYTVKVTGKDLYDLLGSNIVDTVGANSYSINVYIDGVNNYLTVGAENNALFDRTAINRTNRGTVGATGNGVLTQVFVDHNTRDVTIAIINTYLAIADDDYSERYNEVGLDVYSIIKHTASGDYMKNGSDGAVENLDVTGEDFDIADVKDGDKFLVTVAQGEIQTIADPDVLSDVEISSFRRGTSLVTGGTEYSYTTTVEYDDETLEAWTGVSGAVNLKDINYNVYLDQYGYVIGVAEIEVPDNYIFITGVNGNYTNLANMTMQANAIMLDGTMDTITINTRKSDFGSGEGAQGIRTGTEADSTLNKWFTYAVDNNGVYTVKLVEQGAGLNKVGQSHEDRSTVVDYKYNSTTDDATASNRVYGNDKTVYITASIDMITTGSSPTTRNVVIDDVDGVAVGIDSVDITPWNATMVNSKYTTTGTNASISNGIYTLYNKDGYIIAMVAVGEDNGNADSLVYIHSGSVYREAYDKETKLYTWTRSAIVNGEEVTLTEVDDVEISMLQNMDSEKWYQVRYNSKGEVVKVRAEQGAYIDQDTDFDAWSLALSPYTSATYAYVPDYASNAINGAIRTLGVDTVLYHQNFPSDKPHNDGKTLYLTQRTNEAYIRFTDDTKVVFEQMNNREWSTSYWTGESGVNRAIKELHLNDATPLVDDDYNYAISAVIEDGRATSIIIRDRVTHGFGGNTPNANVSTESTRGNIVVRTNVLDARNIQTNITNNGNLVVAIPVTDPAATSGSADISVTVNGIPQTTKLGAPVIDGGYLVYTSSNLELGASDNVVVTIRGNVSVYNTPAGGGAAEASGSVSSSSTPAQIESELDRLKNTKDEEGNTVKGTLNVSGNVDLGDKDIPDNVEVKVPSGSSVTLGGSAAKGEITGAGNVKATGDVTNAENIKVTGNITVDGGSLTTSGNLGDNAVGSNSNPANITLTNGGSIGENTTVIGTVTLDGGSIADGAVIAGDLVVGSETTIPANTTFEATQLNMASGTKLSLDANSDVTMNGAMLNRGSVIVVGNVTYTINNNLWATGNHVNDTVMGGNVATNHAYSLKAMLVALGNINTESDPGYGWVTKTTAP